MLAQTSLKTEPHNQDAFIADDPLAELRRELIHWAEPIIADCILDGYREHQVDRARLTLLSGQHRRLWRAIILNNTGATRALQRDLDGDLNKAGLPAAIATAIDQSVIEELIDIVLKRFKASRERVKGFSLVLLGAASQIGASRAVA